MILQILLATSILFSYGPKHKLTGTMAKSFTLPTPNGQKLSLKEVRGQVVLLNFWATWCEPCKKELPEFELLQERYRKRGLAILAVSVDSNVNNVRAFIKRNDLRLAMLWDGHKMVSKAYDIPAMPSTYVIDRNGVIRYVHKGYSRAEIKRIEAEIDELLDE